MYMYNKASYDTKQSSFVPKCMNDMVQAQQREEAGGTT